VSEDVRRLFGRWLGPGCAHIEDLVYGMRTGARAYVEAGMEHLERTFA
jgi:hypothetical protein